ncbi:putative AlkP superfamily pyrophosphatase or phosphodiesterase [Streptomyces sp. SAI-090]|nr:putative AlkP superfamily pyrophosphatase or phosphodiesterase [Streptomyces sp. SAI-090]
MTHHTPTTGPTPLLVLDVVGLTPRLLHHMPHLKTLARSGSHAPLGTVLPAVTCAAQSTFLTGTHPAEHGIVGNGWYFRELGEVLLWRQHNGLVAGDKLWDAARRAHPGYTVANICWWYAMGADTDVTVTPRPVYYADGRKEPDCYTRPPALHDELTEKLGTFPLFHFWGPGADLVSSQWIIDATRHIMATRHPDLTLCYLPHLDYDLQRFGPDDPRSLKAAADLDRALAPLLDDARAEGRTVVALSEYGITRVSRPVDINRALRRAGLLEVHTQDGMEYLDPMASRAFAVADHQIAHVYVRRPEDLDATRAALDGLPGIGQLLDDEGKKAHHLDHPRAGELVAVAGAGRLVHVLLLARRRPRARLRAARRDPPQTRLRPGRTLHGPARPVRQGQGGHRTGPQEARPALPHGGRAPRPVAYSRQPRPPARERRRRSAAHLLHPPCCRRPHRGHRREVTPAPAGRSFPTGPQ